MKKTDLLVSQEHKRITGQSFQTKTWDWVHGIPGYGAMFPGEHCIVLFDKDKGSSQVKEISSHPVMIWRIFAWRIYKIIPWMKYNGLINTSGFLGVVKSKKALSEIYIKVG